MDARHLHLYKKTLLNKDVQKQEVGRLQKRLWDALQRGPLKGAKKLRQDTITMTGQHGYFESIKHQETRERLGFLTILHAVEYLDVDACVSRCAELKQQITKSIKAFEGAACIGAIEVEVVSIPLMQRALDHQNRGTETIDEDGVITMVQVPQKSERYKLDSCQKLLKHAKGEQSHEKRGLFLIHFHGIVCVKN